MSVNCGAHEDEYAAMTRGQQAVFNLRWLRDYMEADTFLEYDERADRCASMPGGSSKTPNSSGRTHSSRPDAERAEAGHDEHAALRRDRRVARTDRERPEAAGPRPA